MRHGRKNDTESCDQLLTCSGLPHFMFYGTWCFRSPWSATFRRFSLHVSVTTRHRNAVVLCCINMWDTLAIPTALILCTNAMCKILCVFLWGTQLSWHPSVFVTHICCPT